MSMASILTRSSSRRNEGIRSTRSATLPNSDSSPRTKQLSNIGRKKRPRESEPTEDEFVSKKRTKIAVEILSQPKPLGQARSLVINAGLDLVTPPAKATQTEPATITTPAKSTDHRQKFVNGIKHELDRLGPKEADLKGEKRKLRSQEGTRFKSNLSRFFPEYDEVIGNDPREDHSLNFDTPIIIIDTSKSASKQPTSTDTHIYPLKEFPYALFTNLHHAKGVDFAFMESRCEEVDENDPMSEVHFHQIHRRPERQEKTIRNNDKGLAQHEREEVKRILEGLRGHDWLKEIGVSGVTESRKKEYEPARDHFIKGCEAILEKFRTWREEEKRRKLEKEWALAEAEAEAEDEDEVADEEMEDVAVDESDGDPPDYSDVDASAARQLHDEAIARSAPLQASRSMEKRPKVQPISPPKHELHKPFTSFFPKPHQREAALGKHRRSGRSVAAWGHNVPEVHEDEFNLPEEFRDEETLRAHARRKRRDRRVSKD